METKKSNPEPEAIRGHVRRVGFRRVSHGLFLPERTDSDDDQEFERDLWAWLEVLPEGALFTHVTAARLLGWRLPQLPEQVPVFAAARETQSHPRRWGLIVSRLRGKAEPYQACRLPCDQPEEILLRAARDLGVLDLVIMLDSALALGHIDHRRMAAVLASRRAGVRRLRSAWALADGASESAGESLLRIYHVCLEIPVTPQVTLCDERGNVVARADLLVDGTNLVCEYDGAGHRDPGQHKSDLRRERRLAGIDHLRLGFTLSDLVRHELVSMHELDRAVGRPHDPGRLDSWRLLLQESLYSPTGRQRVLNRWQRKMGIVDWPDPA